VKSCIYDYVLEYAFFIFFYLKHAPLQLAVLHVVLISFCLHKLTLYILFNVPNIKMKYVTQYIVWFRSLWCRKVFLQGSEGHYELIPVHCPIMAAVRVWCLASTLLGRSGELAVVLSLFVQRPHTPEGVNTFDVLQQWTHCLKHKCCLLKATRH
jgi:hypothetical protein